MSKIKHTPNTLKAEITQQGLLDIKFVGTITFYFQIGLIIIIVIIYPLYPYIYSKDNYFKEKFETPNKEGETKLSRVIEYQWIKKVFYSFLIPFIISSLLFIVIKFIPFSFLSPIISNLDVTYLLITIMVIGAGALLKMVCFFLKDEFRFYFAKGCFKIFEVESESRRYKYLDLMLDSYNKYLKRVIKIEIKGIDTIYTNIIDEYINKKNDCVLSAIAKAFDGNTLDLFKYLSSTFFIDSEPDKFLVKESSNKSLLSKFKQLGTFLAAGIPIIISIIELYYKSGKY